VREGRDDLRNDLAMTRMNLGNVMQKQGRLEGAVAEYQGAREIYERLVREGRDDLRNDRATTRMNLGSALNKQGRVAEAVAEFLAAREIYDRLVREGRDDLREEVSRTRMNLGIALKKQGLLEEAVAEYQAAGEIYERLVGEGQLKVVASLARCWFNALKAATNSSEEEAISISRRAFRFLHELLPQRAKLTPAAFIKIGKFLRLAEEANICADEAAALAVHYAPPPSPSG
jgi:tetratricopeptide (TPR) repeat protein